MEMFTLSETLRDSARVRHSKITRLLLKELISTSYISPFLSASDDSSLEGGFTISKLKVISCVRSRKWRMKHLHDEDEDEGRGGDGGCGGRREGG